MSNAVHVYVSQHDKGELVMGAGIDAFNSYAQRGSFNIIERQLAAAIELFPVFGRVRVLRTWAGHRGRVPGRVADHRATADGQPVRQQGLGDRRLQGDAGLGLGVRAHDREWPSRTRSTRRSSSTDSPRARWSTSTAPPGSRTDRWC